MTTNPPPLVALPSKEQAAALRESLQAPDDGLTLEQAAVLGTDGESYHTRRRGLQQVVRLALLELARPQYRSTKELRKASRIEWT